MSKLRVLLLTNGDCDNVGDQIIELTASSLIKGAFENLGLTPDDFTISSRAAGMVPKAYAQTRSAELLDKARNAVAAADLVIFGGAPLFNHTYENFYLRTVATLELAQEYGVPVLFSSIGVEKFDPHSPKCAELKRALALPCVRQITTRDDFDSLVRYTEGTRVPIARVSDPAVFANIAMNPRAVPTAPPRFSKRVKRRIRRIARTMLRRHPRARRIRAGADAPLRATRIGLGVTRGGIFKDNRIPFSEAEQLVLWQEVIALLTERGYEYTLFTTGHFADEVFLDTLVRAADIPMANVALPVNSPEELVSVITSCDGVIAYRLHASITSFAFDVPSIGLAWNPKVTDFYASIGMSERSLDHEKWTANHVVDAIEAAMRDGVSKDVDYLMSVYDTLFAGLKPIVAPESAAAPYSYDELTRRLPRYGGTSATRYQQRVRWKLRRVYSGYQTYSAAYHESHARTEPAPS